MALKLGMTVGDLLGRIGSLELTEWQAYFDLEAEDYRREQLSADASDALDKRRVGKGRRRR